MSHYFSITPSKFLSEDQDARKLVCDEFEAVAHDLGQRQGRLTGSLRDLPFGKFEIHFHNFEPKINIPWTDEDPQTILGLRGGQWERLEGSERTSYDASVPCKRVEYAHKLTGLKLTVEMRTNLPGALYGVFVNLDGQKYIGKITPLNKEAESV